ncbi:LOW QUALITY PROTEIN: putative phospholipase B-like 2 [Suncus etruscus]|uniref:LOW QUALITY PROTEIN: putative phospholipase B-like 2 n=1 Tax=Suncus etruscus TaxID=109475 RepID=UPI00210FD915|nr:LOW QUALITY PROTEIN: putative phospholipase B-like 2 [Suncus etruscus]
MASEKGFFLLAPDPVKGPEVIIYEGRVSFPIKEFFIKPLGFLLLQISGELEVLELALNKTRTRQLLPDKYVFIVHNMLRIIKKYHFFQQGTHDNSSPIPSNKRVFLSHPGVLFSCDDSYIIESQLVALETTISNRYPKLWQIVHPKGSVLEWLNSNVTNYLALDGFSWADIFKEFNSATRMLLMEDKNSELYNNIYWARYNILSFKAMFSGLPSPVALYGDCCSYSRTPRLHLPANHSPVCDMASMLRLMRYKNFLHDSLSLCGNFTPQPNAKNAILIHWTSLNSQ